MEVEAGHASIILKTTRKGKHRGMEIEARHPSTLLKKIINKRKTPGMEVEARHPITLLCVEGRNMLPETLAEILKRQRAWHTMDT